MKNLTHLTNKELLSDTKELAQKEREILSDILYLELKNLISHELKTGKMTEVIECSVRKVLNGIRKKKGIKIPGKETEEKKEETKNLISRAFPQFDIRQ